MFKYIPLLYLLLIGCSDSNFMLEPVDEIIEHPMNQSHRHFGLMKTQD